jgi:L-glyceraldehyde 3-phosphate reductase
MKYRTLGATSIQVSAIGFGCGGAAGLMINGTFEQQLAAVARALELGINYFDEAPDYGDGVSETNLGRVLRELNARPVITTKVEVRASDLGDIARHVERSVEESLRRLQLDQVDVVQVHNGPVDTSTHLQGREYRTLSLDDYLRKDGALEGLRRVRSSGKARHIGFICRGDDAGPARELIDTGEFSLINIVLTLLNPTAVLPGPPGSTFRPDFGQLIPYAHQRGVGVAIYSPLAGGLLTDAAIEGGAPHPLSGAARRARVPSEQPPREAAAFRLLAERSGQSLAKAAYRFVLSQPGVTTVLGGFSDIEQLEEAVAASEAAALTPAELSQIESVWLDASGRP